MTPRSTSASTVGCLVDIQTHNLSSKILEHGLLNSSPQPKSNLMVHELPG